MYPTGIDIRQGLQYECIGCAACIDVCDDVMQKMNDAPGLVRYDTQNGLALRAPFDVDVVRDRAALARQVDDGEVENLYRLQIMNATERPQQYRISADGLPGLRLVDPRPVTVAPTEAHWVSVTLRVPPQTAASTPAGAHVVHFQIERAATGDDGTHTLREKSTFVLPR